MEDNIKPSVTKIMPQEPQSQGMSTKAKWYLVLVIIALAIAGYGYYWIHSTNQLRTEAAAVVEKANKFDTLTESIKAESDRCKTFIAQSQGDFGSFEYCKGFVDWANNHL